jgi:uncharacterized protein YjbJ (UPF0337 family)
MSVSDKAKNSAEAAKGSVKDFAGRIKDDPKLELEGKVDRAKADIKQAGEKLKDAFKK